MRVTQEADYAIRICCVLDDARSRLGASEIAERAGITQKFALKILRKLSLAKIVRSFAGNKGGYELNRDANDLTIAEILELIEGAISLSKCMDCEYECTRNPNKTNCKMHISFCLLSREVKQKLSKITVRTLTDPNVTTNDVKNIIK
jgi:Rrf2 family protein